MKKLLLLVLCFSAAAAHAQTLGWKQVGTETFTLSPMGTRFFVLPRGKWKIEFQAEAPIYAGVLTPQKYAQIIKARYLPLTAFNGFACSKPSILEAQLECNVGIPKAVLAIRDKRGPISGAIGATEGLVGVLGTVHAPLSAPAGAALLSTSEKRLKDNTIKITAYSWSCLENCPASPK